MKERILLCAHYHNRVLGSFMACAYCRVMKAAGQAKAPLVHSEALAWLHACVKDFGAAVLPAPQVVAFAVSELEHVNPKVCVRALYYLLRTCSQYTSEPVAPVV